MDSTVEGQSKVITETNQGKTHVYECPECQKHYSIYSSFYSHKKKHKKPSIQCSDCPERFSLKAELYRHTFLIHKGTQLPTVAAMSTSVMDENSGRSFEGNLLGMERAFAHAKSSPEISHIPRSNLSSCFALDTFL
jgi:DNA-directed RNA polymerase subunit RPC12/RpoP